MSVNQLSGGVRGFVAEVTEEGRLQTQVANTVANKPANYTVYQSRVVVSTTSTTVVAARDDRQDLVLMNLAGGETAYLMLDGATATTDGYPLAPGEEFHVPGFRSEAAVKAATASGSTTILALDMA